MNKRIDFTQQEGFGFTQDALDFMQVSYRTAISALASAFGNKVILSGVIESGANLTSGWVVIDGELLPFIGGLKAANIMTAEATDIEQFGDLSTKTVYFTKSAMSAALGGYPYTDFKRLDTVVNILTNLNTLITTFTGHKHVVADITDFPTIPEQKILYATTYHIGDVVTQDQIITISFADVGTANYVVSGSLRSLSADFNQDNDVVWMAKDKTPTSFKLCLRDLALVVQNLNFDYALIKIS